MIQLVSKYWWVFALRGLLAVLFGLIAISWPGLTLVMLVYVFGFYVLFEGVLSIIAAFGRRDEKNWWVVLVEGIAGVVFAILTFSWPAITAVLLLVFIAIWALATGILKIIAAIRQDTLRAALSNAIGRSTSSWQRHIDDRLPDHHVSIDAQLVLDQLARRRRWSQLEEEVLARVPHHRLEYERDLRATDVRTAALDGVLDFLGLTKSNLTTDLSPSDYRPLSDVVTNLDEVLDSALAKLIELMNLRASWVVLLNDQQDSLELVAKRGLPEQVALAHVHCQWNRSLCAQVLEMGQPQVFSQQPDGSPAQQHDCQTARYFQEQGLVFRACIPLTSIPAIVSLLAKSDESRVVSTYS